MTDKEESKEERFLDVPQRVRQYLNQLSNFGGLPRVAKVNPLHMQRLVTTLAQYDIAAANIHALGLRLSEDPSNPALVEEFGKLLDGLGKISADSFTATPPILGTIILPR